MPRPGSHPIFLLPLGTSAVTLGFGYIIALDQPPLNLRRSMVLIPLAYTLIALPFVVRSILPALRSLNPRLRESAAVMGAERYYPAIQLLVWGGRTPASALEAAIAEAYGRA